MKVVIVTSDVTYVPKNYATFFSGLLKRAKQHIVGVVFVRTDRALVFRMLPALFVAGAFQTARTLIANMTLPDERMRLLRAGGIPVVKQASLAHDDTRSWIAELKPDIILNARNREVFGSDILNLPRMGCVNIHHGLLPRNRGAFCDLHALAEGRQAGFSLHGMTKVLDAGPVFKVHPVSQSTEQSYAEYLLRSADVEASVVAEFLEGVDKSDALPEGMTDATQETKTYKTPRTIQEIRSLRRGGIQL